MKSWTLSATALFLVSALGCGGGQGSSTPRKDRPKEVRYRIAAIPKGTTHVFWKSVHAGAEKAARELGNVVIEWQGPLEENDTEGQINVVQNFVSKKVHGICLAPNDSTALVDAVRLAKSSGIPVVIFDSGLEDEDSFVSYVATDNYNGGVLAARRLAEVLGYRPKAEGKSTERKKAESQSTPDSGTKGSSMVRKGVILLRYKVGSESTEQREKGFLETLKKEYPEIRILVENEYSGTTRESSLDKAQNLLTKYEKQVEGIFAVCEPNSMGVLEALKSRGLERQVKFVAFDPSPQLIEGMADDMIHGIVLQDPVTMGYKAVMTLVDHLEGKKVEKRIATGEYVATPENMNGKDAAGNDMQRLLNPVQF